MIERTSPDPHATAVDALVERGVSEGRLQESEIERLAERLALDGVALESLRERLAAHGVDVEDDCGQPARTASSRSWRWGAGNGGSRTPSSSRSPSVSSAGTSRRKSA